MRFCFALLLRLFELNQSYRIGIPPQPTGRLLDSLTAHSCAYDRAPTQLVMYPDRITPLFSTLSTAVRTKRAIPGRVTRFIPYLGARASWLTNIQRRIKGARADARREPVAVVL